MWPFSSLYHLWLDAGSLGVEAASVIGARTFKVVAGGSEAEAEVRLMVEEKIKAAFSIYRQAWQGKLGVSPSDALKTIIAHYMLEVQANRLRLAAS